jgi:hypothetical protein
VYTKVLEAQLSDLLLNGCSKSFDWSVAPKAE